MDPAQYLLWWSELLAISAGAESGGRVTARLSGQPAHKLASVMNRSLYPEAEVLVTNSKIELATPLS